MIDIKEELSVTLARQAEMVPVEDNLEAILTGTIPVRLSSIADRRRRRTWPLAAAAASVVLAGTAGLVWVSQANTESPAASGATQPVEGDVLQGTPTVLDGPAPTQAPAVVANQDVPEEQIAYFQDGKVTLREYQEAYGAFVQCAADAGVGDDLREQGRDEVTGIIEYTTQTLLLPPGQTPPGQSDGSELNECYNRWFFHVEVAFHTSDPAVLAAEPQEQLDFFNENFRPCLEQIGVAVPDDLEFQDENWGPLNDEAARALQDGRCVLA